MSLPPNTPKRPREPLFNFSEPIPAWTCGVLIALHGLFEILPDAILRLTQPFMVLGFSRGEMITSPSSLLLHGALHGDWGHVLMNSMFVAIFGVIVCRAAGSGWRGAGRFFAIFLLSVIIGGIVQSVWTIAVGDSAYVIGASGGASGLFAAAAYALGGRTQLLQWGLGWLAINALMVFSNVVGIMPNDIAVQAHIGGYVGGGLLALMFLRPNSTDFKITR